MAQPAAGVCMRGAFTGPAELVCAPPGGAAWHQDAPKAVAAGQRGHQSAPAGRQKKPGGCVSFSTHIVIGSSAACTRVEPGTRACNFPRLSGDREIAVQARMRVRMVDVVSGVWPESRLSSSSNELGAGITKGTSSSSPAAELSPTFSAACAASNGAAKEDCGTLREKAARKKIGNSSRGPTA